jgi:hypothetical protein
VTAHAGFAELTALLTEVARRLEDAYATCVTVEIALAAQNADHNAEIARCLHAGVAEPIAVELRRVRKAISRSKDPEP